MPKVYLSESARQQAQLERVELKMNMVLRDALCTTAEVDTALSAKVGITRQCISGYRCHPEKLNTAQFGTVRRLVRATMTPEQALKFMGY
jgi:hypothetical protein